MIHWQDFILDENIGPVLSPELFEGQPEPISCRRKRLGSPSIMDDARGTQTEAIDVASFQETRQEQRPARMVGLSSLDSARSHTDVSGDRVENIQRHPRRGEA